MAKPRKRKKSRAKFRKRKILVYGFETLVLLSLLFGVYIVSKYTAIKDITFDATKVMTNEEVEEEAVSAGYTTIALFGLDTDGVYDIESGGRSDSIIIASINNDTKEVKLASVYRDTYLNLTSGKYSKANAAYSNGGAEQALSMLNMNLDLTIDKYIAINYNALIDVIDALGGVEVEIASNEAVNINDYMIDISDATGRTFTTLPEIDGTYTLTGIQATAYCRIRYGGGDDYKRTERQRLIIEKILEKAKTTDVSTLNDIVDTISSEVCTNLELTEIASLTSDAPNYTLSDTTGFPFTKTWASTGYFSAVIANGLAYNVSELHEFLYNDTDYQPSSTVQEISDYIETRTGVSTEEIDEDDTDTSTDTAISTDGTSTED